MKRLTVMVAAFSILGIACAFACGPMASSSGVNPAARERWVRHRIEQLERRHQKFVKISRGYQLHSPIDGSLEPELYYEYRARYEQDQIDQFELQALQAELTHRHQHHHQTGR